MFSICMTDEERETLIELQKKKGINSPASVMEVLNMMRQPEIVIQREKRSADDQRVQQFERSEDFAFNREGTWFFSRIEA